MRLIGTLSGLKAALCQLLGGKMRPFISTGCQREVVMKEKVIFGQEVRRVSTSLLISFGLTHQKALVLRRGKSAKC